MFFLTTVCLDEINEKLLEYEAIGDYAAEDQWLTVIYQQVQDAYHRYAVLPADAQLLVEGREKLLELDYIWSLMPRAEMIVGYTANYTPTLLSSGASFVLYTQGASGQYYAIDGNGNAVAISINANGEIIANVSNRSTLHWTISVNGSNATIRSASTNRYLYPSGNSVTSTPCSSSRCPSLSTSRIAALGLLRSM